MQPNWLSVANIFFSVRCRAHSCFRVGRRRRKCAIGSNRKAFMSNLKVTQHTRVMLPCACRALWASISARDDATDLRWIDVFSELQGADFSAARESTTTPDAPVRLVTPHAGAAMHYVLVRADNVRMEVFISERYGAMLDALSYADTAAAEHAIHAFLDEQ